MISFFNQCFSQLKKCWRLFWNFIKDRFSLIWHPIQTYLTTLKLPINWKLFLVVGLLIIETIGLELYQNPSDALKLFLHQHNGILLAFMLIPLGAALPFLMKWRPRPGQWPQRAQAWLGESRGDVYRLKTPTPTLSAWLDRWFWPQPELTRWPAGTELKRKGSREWEKVGGRRIKRWKPKKPWLNKESLQRLNDINDELRPLVQLRKLSERVAAKSPTKRDLLINPDDTTQRVTNPGRPIIRPFLTEN